MAQSAAATAKTLATSTQYNNLRLDVLSTTLGHWHDGTNGREHGDGNLKLRNPADTFSYTLKTSAITANLNLTVPLITVNDTLAVLTLAQTFLTGVKTFNSSILAIRNPADTFSYTVVAAAITAARDLTLPLLTGTGTLAVLENVVSGGQTFAGAITFSLAGSAVSITGATGNTLAVDTNVLIVDATNDRVGIGTASPSNLLHVVHPTTHTSIMLNSSALARVVNLGFYKNGSATINWEFSSRNELDTPNNRLELYNTAGQAILTYFQTGGMNLGAPTGGDKGLGTLNATAVYDDNVLLTGYVTDVFEGRFIQAQWDAAVPNRVIPTRFDNTGTAVVPGRTEMRNHDRASAFAARAARDLDPDLYFADTLARGELPAMPTRAEWRENGPLSVGELVQRLWETCEVQAVHIGKLSQRVRALGG